MLTSPADEAPVKFSIVIPAYNESENIPLLLAEIAEAFADRGPVEVLVIDDGSTDSIAEKLAPIMSGQTPLCPVLSSDVVLRVLRHHMRSGQSAAVRTGVKAARADWVGTLDGDGQNDPRDLPRLLQIAQTEGEEGPAMVGGLRLTRRDVWSKRVASRFANAIRQALLRDGCVDTGCGLKVFRRDVFLDLPYFGAMHRFLPALVQACGYRVAFAPVGHRPRHRGVSKYGNFSRGMIGIVDLLGVYWLRRRIPTRSPVNEVIPRKD
ncbi:Glycosyltransferase family 2 protein [Azospirillaceae bacterium]